MEGGSAVACALRSPVRKFVVPKEAQLNLGDRACRVKGAFVGSEQASRELKDSPRATWNSRLLSRNSGGILFRAQGRTLGIYSEPRGEKGAPSRKAEIGEKL